VHAGVKAAFPGHEVRTVAEIGRCSSADGALLEAAQRSFDVFVTIDRRLPTQQQIGALRLGVILIRVPNNTILAYRSLFTAILEAAETVKPGEIVEVA
jgi:hypothetical protein